MFTKRPLPHGMTRIPWGFVVGCTDGQLVATTAAADRFRRAELGEAAIRVATTLGISLNVLEELIPVEKPAEILAKLQEKRS